MQKYLVAVDAPLKEPLTYLSNQASISIGKKVTVGLGKSNRKVSGLIVGNSNDEIDVEKLKSIVEVDESLPALSQVYLDWAMWMANYYKHPIGQILKLFFPPLKKKEGKARKKSPLPDLDIDVAAKLNEEQDSIVKSILLKNGFNANLIFGVTGSGKTEVYMALFEHHLSKGGKGLFLLPEISLTPQLLNRFTKRFGNRLAVIHSQLTDREKTIQWWRMVEGGADILLGARSAIFCPIPNLSLIVVDEEHETSYKQEEKFRYHARDIATVLAKKLNIPIVFGSATPSLESWLNTLTNKYHLHKLTARAVSKTTSEISIVDLKKEEKSQDYPFWMSKQLFEKIQDRLNKGEQTALFLNRRGMSPSVLCSNCGYTVDCPNCSVSLTLHAKSHLHCHYCGYHQNFKDICPSCEIGELRPLGLGTEQVEEDLRKIFPSARIARADRDEIQNRQAMEDLIFKMENLKIDILIGTQMISKGLDFPNLSLVSILLADIGFNIQDFRANERSFQLLTQVAGRAGRHRIQGEVIIQTFNPEHPVLKHVLDESFEDFSIEELEFRKELNYPPYFKISSIKISSTYKNKAFKAAVEASEILAKIIKSSNSNNFYLLGPSEAPLFKLNGKYRYQILIKAAEHQLISYLLDQFNKHYKSNAGTKVLIDVDPQQLS